MNGVQLWPTPRALHAKSQVLNRDVRPARPPVGPSINHPVRDADDASRNRFRSRPDHYLDLRREICVGSEHSESRELTTTLRFQWGLSWDGVMESSPNEALLPFKAALVTEGADDR